MSTASDIITSAGRAIGYLGRTQVLTAADANDGLTCFNRMLDSWSLESLMSYVTIQGSFPLVINKQTYTVGTGGDINATRPLDIITAFLRDVNNIDYGMDVVPRDKWDRIGQKNITSQIPDTLFYDSQFPLGVINIFPLPLLAYTVFYNYTTNQVDPAALTTTISMPLGYERAYVLNLALDMMNFGFPCLLDEKGLSNLMMKAAEAKANVKRMNIKEVIAQYDDSIVSRSYATYNIYTDNMPRG